jgi:hypothetical protein
MQKTPVAAPINAAAPSAAGQTGNGASPAQIFTP